MRIAVLALQGAFVEHRNTLSKLGVDSFEIRKRSDLYASFDGLILPGGESTTMQKLLVELELFEPIRELIVNGLPVFGTCAGLILLAKQIEHDVPRFATMNICCRRNAYGRQLGSFVAVSNFADFGQIPMVFIRAPQILSVENDIQILATVNGAIVAAQQNKQLVTSFHPELTGDKTVHQYFLNNLVSQ